MYYRSKNIEILFSGNEYYVLWFRVTIPFTYTVLSFESHGPTIDKALNMVIKDGDPGLPEMFRHSIKLNVNLYWLRVDGWYKELSNEFSYRCPRWMIYREMFMRLFRPKEQYVIPKD